MNKNQTRQGRGLVTKLAKATFRDGSIDMEIAKFTLTKLSRKHLVHYFLTLKRIIYQDSLRVVSKETLPVGVKKALEKRYEGKIIFFEEDSRMGEGIKIIQNDTVFDFSFQNYINTIFNQLKT